MNSYNHNKIYTAAELRRYHSGEMPPEEMHLLERAALEDPMLADALEGYGKEKQGDDALSFIKQKLDTKSPIAKGTKVISFNKKMWSAVAVAASLLLLGGYAFFAMQSKQAGTANEPQIALKQPTPQKVEPQKTTSDSTNAKPEQGATLSANAVELEEKKTAEAHTNAKTSAIVSSTEGAFKAVMPYTIPNIESNKDEDLSKLTTQDDNVHMKNNEDADKKAVSTSKPAIANVQADSSFATNYAIADARNQQVTLENTQQINQFFDNDGIDDKNNATALNDVVVTGIQANRKDRNKSEKKVTAAAVSKYKAKDIQNPFETYLSQQHPTCYKADGGKASGKVKLNFKVDKNGRPTNIKIIGSLSEACDNEAIRILSSGPNWEVKGDKHRTAIITFQ